MSKILVSYQPSLIPVLKLLAPTPGTQVYTLHPEFTKMLADLDIPAKTLGQDLEVDVRPTALKEAARLISHVSLGNYSTKGLPAHSVGFMRGEIAGALYPRLDGLLTLVLILDATHPDLILLHNDVEPSTRAVAQWGRAHGVPVLHVPHAVYVDGFGRGAVGSDIHDLVSASAIACAGPYQEAWYQARGGVTRVTGLPQFDRLAKPAMSYEKARRLLQLSPHQPVVMYASSWRQDTNLLGCHDGIEESYRNFLQATKSMPGVQFVVKTHPRNGNLEWHVKTAKDANAPVLVTGQHLDIILAACDAVIAYGPSGVLMEAAHFLEVGLVSIGGYQEDPEVLTIDESATAITQGIEQALAHPPSTLSFAYRYCGVPDGLAYQRVALYAKELLEGNHA